jgi:hypothetical protein
MLSGFAAISEFLSFFTFSESAPSVTLHAQKTATNVKIILNRPRYDNCGKTANQCIRRFAPQRSTPCPGLRPRKETPWKLDRTVKSSTFNCTRSNPNLALRSAQIPSFARASIYTVNQALEKQYLTQQEPLPLP